VFEVHVFIGGRKVRPPQPRNHHPGRDGPRSWRGVSVSAAA
jgi:hypothetical protein